MRALALPAILLLCANAVADPSAAPVDAPWDSPPLSADPLAIARAAHALRTPPANRQFLLDERVYHIADNGTYERRSHIVFRVLTAAGVASGPGLEIPWQPWCESRPDVRVRVISPDGSSHALDAATIEDAGLSLGGSLYGDNRVLRAPFPALSLGAVVEEEIVERLLVAPFSATAVHRELLVQAYPTERMRVVLDAPTALPLRWSLHGPVVVRPERREVGGRAILTFDIGPRPALEVVADAPMDQLLPTLAFSTGGSWQDVARGYDRIAEAELAKTPQAALATAARAALGDATTSDRAKIASALLAFVRREVRPVGVEFGHSSLVPHPPAETLQRKFGDCKDQALLLVGLLRAAGLPARLALLRVAGVDADEKLPGLEGFDHVIVYVPGAHALWIDSTDEWARIDELPPTDQGRMALVVDGGTRALVRTPIAPLGANRMIATRDIILAEAGAARVADKIELWGAFDRVLRSFITNADEKRTRQVVEALASVVLGSTKIIRYQVTDVHRIDLPMRIELDVDDPSVAFTDDSGAELSFPLSRLTQNLPDWMRRPDSPSRRLVDFNVNQMAVFEWKLRVTPPPSLALEALPRDSDVPMGPLRLTKRFTREANGVVQVVARLEIGKTRFSPAEVDAIRAAYAALESADPIKLKFLDVARAHLVAGRLREALDAYRRLVALHPKEALHHQDLVSALMALGLGEAARDEARRAVSLEPQSAIVQRVLAWTLEHDLIGRSFVKGFDRPGAEAALGRALALAPNDVYAHVDLGVLLEYQADGHRYGVASATAQAIAEYRAVDQAALQRLGFADNPLWDLVHLHRWKELEQATRGVPRSGAHARLRLTAVAAQSGAAAALAEAASYPTELRAAAIRDAAETLLWQRLYPQAAGLFEQASHDPGSPSWVAARSDIARRARRIEESPFDDRDPTSAVRRFYSELLRPDDEAHMPARVHAIAASDPPLFDEQDESSLMASRRSWRRHNLPHEVVRDVVAIAGVAEKEGDDHTGWRVRYTKPMDSGVDTEYVVLERGQYRVLPPRQSTVHIGHRVLEALAAKDFAVARRWLDWMSESYRNGDPIDRSTPSPFARVWNPGGGGSPEQARVAGLMLLVDRSGPDNKTALEGLRAVAASPPPGVPLDAVDLVIARALLALDRPEDALAVAAAAPEPASRLWFAVRFGALTKLSRWEELRLAAKAELARVPDDAAALRALSRADRSESRWDAFDRDMDRLVATGHATQSDYNDHAWAALVRKGADDKALDDARRAVEMSHRQVRSILHTLAAIEASLGHSREAYATLIESIDVGDGTPIPSDYFVLGCIAENLGLPDVALAEYRKVVRKEPSKPSTFDAPALAEARVRALAK